ncbi:hypothetical protein H8K47_09190 [Undibacterium sp. CY7W]|uniref:Uncharacterized protein n=1 Tax=Undibacterium rugosum TaxID=2762291 RepID=A0A923IAB7_9BURK|nr:hypothetical protein [Undibacterium rugosum]MBC3935535.1 hypothetical protein [Undibacterium rugosum]
MIRYLNTVPHPWSREIIEHAISDSFQDAKKSIEETAGGKLWRTVQDLDDSIRIFHESTTELLDEICLFGDRSKNPTFWHRANVNEVEIHTRVVKKKLFYCTSSLMALVDHARRFYKATPVCGYTDQLKAAFSSPGLHDFLQGLRNYNTHWRIAQANWIIRHDFKSGVRVAQFTVTKPELLAWDGWSAKAKVFIDSAPDAIDIYGLFFEYRKHVQHFYAWHKGAVLEKYGQDIQPYFEYKRLYEGIMKKCTWNLIIANAPKTVNPYQYLDQYLTTLQIERLLAFKHRSDGQVDALIQMLGMEEFCDEFLREKVLALFRPLT